MRMKRSKLHQSPKLNTLQDDYYSNPFFCEAYPFISPPTVDILALKMKKILAQGKKKIDHALHHEPKHVEAEPDEFLQEEV